MIDKALRLLQAQVHDHLVRQPDLTVENVVKLVNVTRDDGSVAVPKESIGLTLVNVEEERVNRPQQHAAKLDDGTIVTTNPDLRLNLYVLFSANFTDYLTSMTYLSAVVGFFQSHTVFTPATAPAMDAAIGRLVVELYSLNLEQQNHLWGYLGGKYLPSVVYKVRLLYVQELAVRRQGERVRHIDVTGRGVRR